MRLKITALLVTLSTSLFAQNTAPTDTTYWRNGGTGSITFSQVSLTNWAAGGQNSVAINSNLSLFANRVKGRGKWENSMDLAYGLIRQGDASFTKSDDLINIVTKYSYRMNRESGKWFFSALMDFKTQFYEGVDEEGNFISDFMAPGYLTVGLGVSYDPTDQLSFSYQPVTGKFTFVRDQELANQGAYGVDPAVFAADGTTVITPGKKSRAEFGSFFRAKFKNDIFESRLELFTSYLENFGTIDVNWQNALVMQLTKVLSMNAFAQLIYDKDIKIAADDNGDGIIDESTELKDRVQFKSVIGIGLTYKFGKQKSE
ncbi:DUF3078 domain-containing protein [Ekhidna sp.]|jgi:hypothetical protein|uniref:DUF3078 domain-containing protein n=1 Tax=Ekhidna sp. TaxID=2608089 RepID=UPI0032ED9170